MGNNATTVALQDTTENGHHKKKHFKAKTKCDLLTHAASGKQKKKPSNKKTGMIPEPDYGMPEEECENESGKQKGMRFSEEGLVIPKKPQNPCMESTERQSLHRELMFNQKIGKSVIGQKTELHRAFEKLREEHKRKELEEEKLLKKSALERKLEEQANKLRIQEEELEGVKKLPQPDQQPEFLRVHARLCPAPVDTPSS